MKQKPNPHASLLTRLLPAGLLVVATIHANAQTTYFWDANGASAGTGGTGIWNTSSVLWRNGSDTGSLEVWPNVEPSTQYAQLAGTAGTITLNNDSQNISLNRIIFDVTGYTIAGPGSGTAALQFSGSAPQIATAASVSAVISANITGTTGITKAGAGTLTLSGTNSYSGNTTVSAGTLNISGDHSGANGAWAVNNNSILNFQSGSVIEVGAGNNITTANGDGGGARSLNVFGTVSTSSTSSVQIRGRATFNLESGADWTQGGALTIQPLNSGFGATMNVKTGSSFTYEGGTNITLAKSTSAGSGSATLNISGGTFTTSRGISNTNAGTGSGNTNLNFSNGGTLKISENISSLMVQGSTALNVNLNTGGGVIDTNGFDTSIAVRMAGTGGLTKDGTGSLTLAGSNTYQGLTTVSAGTLYVTGSLANSAVNVSANGTIGSNGLPGTLANGLSLAEGASIDLTGATLGPASTGILSITGGSLTLGNLSFQNLIGWDWAAAEPGTYRIIDGTFGISWGDTAYLTPETAYDFNNGKKGYFEAGSLNVVIIPEPHAALLGGLGLLALLRRKRLA